MFARQKWLQSLPHYLAPPPDPDAERDAGAARVKAMFDRLAAKSKEGQPDGSR